MSRIKIIERDEAIDEKMLTRYENQGLTLISANHVTKEWKKGELRDQSVSVNKWVYHFRIAASGWHNEA